MTLMDQLLQKIEASIELDVQRVQALTIRCLVSFHKESLNVKTPGGETIELYCGLREVRMSPGLLSLIDLYKSVPWCPSPMYIQNVPALVLNEIQSLAEGA